MKTESLIQFSLFGSEMLKKTASPGKSSASVYLPADWAGDEVAVIRLVESEKKLPWGVFLSENEQGQMWRCPFCLSGILIEPIREGAWQLDETILCGDCNSSFRIGSAPRWMAREDEMGIEGSE
jgi:hypothetical protein